MSGQKQCCAYVCNVQPKLKAFDMQCWIRIFVDTKVLSIFILLHMLTLHNTYISAVAEYMYVGRCVFFSINSCFMHEFLFSYQDCLVKKVI
jgi:hypothetical protein